MGRKESRGEQTVREKERYQPPAMQFRVRGIIYRIAGEDIIYMESLNRQVIVHTTTGILVVPYARLCEYRQSGAGFFVQCHRSMLVNPWYIKEILPGKRKIILADSWGEVAIGRKYMGQIRHVFDADEIWRYTVHRR